MQKLYDGFVTMCKEVVHVHVLQQQSKDIVQTLKNIHATIAHVQKWKMRYKGAPPKLVNKMKPHIEPEKEKVWMLIQNYEQLTPFISGIQASYVRLYNNLDVMVRKHMIP